jgi:hypothetical protein
VAAACGGGRDLSPSRPGRACLRSTPRVRAAVFGGTPRGCPSSASRTRGPARVGPYWPPSPRHIVSLPNLEVSALPDPDISVGSKSEVLTAALWDGLSAVPRQLRERERTGGGVGTATAESWAAFGGEGATGGGGCGSAASTVAVRGLRRATQAQCGRSAAARPTPNGGINFPAEPPEGAGVNWGSPRTTGHACSATAGAGEYVGVGPLCGGVRLRARRLNVDRPKHPHSPDRDDLPDVGRLRGPCQEPSGTQHKRQAPVSTAAVLGSSGVRSSASLGRPSGGVVAGLTTCTVCAWCGALISDGLLPDGYLSHGICSDCTAK